MKIIDTHCHLYASEFADDRDAMIARAENEGVSHMLMPAIDRSTHEGMLALEAAHPKCMAMMGLHPCSVKADFREELVLIEEYFQKRKFVAVGETGLDLYWDKTFFAEQQQAFQRQIEWALAFDIPVVIHSRNATDECIQMVRDQQKGKLKGVFHCFSGSTEQAQEITDLGFYLGIGGVVTFKNAGLDVVLEKHGRKNSILETDAPYLAPVPFRGKRNESSYLSLIAQKLATIWQVSVDEVAAITSHNAAELFSLQQV
jgi:TatD DNase family protein